MRSTTLLLAPVLLAAGCTCRQDYSFPPAEGVVQSAEPGDVGSWLSLDTDPEHARITMSYYDRTAGALMYAVGTPGSDDTWDWAYEKVDGWAGSNGLDPGNVGMYCSQRTAPDGTVWIGYYDATHGGLLAAHRTGGPVWELEQADPIGGQWASLALDGDGHPVIAHYDADKGALRITRRSGDSWSTEEAWVGQPFLQNNADGTVTSRPAGAGQYARIEIVDGTEYVAFYDSAQQQLVLLEGTTGAWRSSVVDGTGSVLQGAVANAGAWPSLLVDGNTLRIAYQDVGAETLRMATRQGASWTLETVDSTQWRGADTEIFDDGGSLAIVYFDGYDNNQMIAQAGAQWKITKLGGDDGAVGYHNEVVVVSGQTWVGSYDFSHHALALGKLGL